MPRSPILKQAIRLIYRALDWVINLIETARSYGTSEELIGKVLQGIATVSYLFRNGQIVSAIFFQTATVQRYLCPARFLSLELVLRSGAPKSIWKIKI